MKFAVSVFTILLAVVGALVFVQYQVYSDQSQSTENGFSYSQEIEVEYRDNSLDIRHHFKNLPNDDITIVWPDNAVDAECFLESENACKRLNDGKTKFEKGENGSQSVSYVIPLKDGLKSGTLLKDVFALLDNGSVKFSTIHITTQPDVEGSWVTGLPLVGYQQLSLVNYSMFTGLGMVKDLYWQKSNFSFTTSKASYSFYSSKGVTSEEQQRLNALNTISDDHIAIVNVKNVPKQQGYRILFVDSTNTNSITRLLTMQQLEDMYKFSGMPNWLKQVVGSVIANEDIGFAKSKEVLNVLRAELNEEQLAQFKANLISLEGKKVTPTILDEQLSQVLGTYTEYLSLNVDSEVVYPFVYGDERSIFLNGKEQKQLHILLKDNQIWYPADALLKAIGYKTSEGANGYYVKSKNRAYRFPANEFDFYVFNQRRFNISTDPFVQIASTRYIEESYVQRLFLVDIKKTEQTIELTTTAEQ